MFLSLVWYWINHYFFRDHAFQCYNFVFAIQQTQMVIKYPKPNDSLFQVSLLNNFNFANSAAYNDYNPLNASELNARFANDLALASNKNVYSDACSHKISFNAIEDTDMFPCMSW